MSETARDYADEYGPLEDTEGLDPSTWPTVVKAAKLAHVTTKTIYQWASQGDVRFAIVNGQKRFHPEDVAQMTSPAESAADSLVRVMAEQTERLLKLTTEPHSKMLRHFETYIDKQAKRIADLEELQLKFYGQYEEALSLRHERDLEIEKTRRQQDRIDKGVATLEEWIPKLAGQAIGRLKVQRLIETLTDEQIVFLREMDAITEQQASLLAQIRGSHDESAKQAQEREQTGAAVNAGFRQEPSGSSGQDSADQGSEPCKKRAGRPSRAGAPVRKTGRRKRD